MLGALTKAPVVVQGTGPGTDTGISRHPPRRSRRHSRWQTGGQVEAVAVSYTHLTLPTILLV